MRTAFMIGMLSALLLAAMAAFAQSESRWVVTFSGTIAFDNQLDCKRMQRQLAELAEQVNAAARVRCERSI